ncbi:uncharacterized protein N0V89_007116 [Didymosphaeria variabile]|uniref:DUF6699 domain-containing protein n=1 Tax=Didymosphaeria variabile TaxID=1932322 RepID=A0A9W9C9X7_9PLEO|nr:uncharacterized protein N0V89_007116 [Didymosphaeria variabile]KAJ4351773.1 hypothetical protein N0V89_007116 [Didymosphaeria variabile]
MAADTADSLKKVDSLVEEPKKEPAKRRASSLRADVFNMADLEKEGKKIEIAPETQKLSWKLNKSPTTVDDPEVLKKPLTSPLVRKIDLHFPLGLEVTARNLKGVTIKDALDAIYKQFKKKVRLDLLGLFQPHCQHSAHPDASLFPQSCCRLFNQPADNRYQADDELGESPYLAGFEWDPEECYTRFVVHQKKEGAPPPSKKKKKGGDE